MSEEQPKRRPGRPRKVRTPGEEIVQLAVYVTEDERTELYARAEQQGVSAAQWIAGVLRRELKKPAKGK